MTRSIRTRLVAPLLAAALGLTVVGLTTTPAFAQNEPTPAEGDSSGRPLDGYFVAAILAGGALFIVGKTARR
jgi:hypothetical protein